jgi:hypothetical protein
MNWILFSGYNKRNVLLADEMGLGNFKIHFRSLDLNGPPLM